MNNRFYRSRKFIYALGTFLAALIVWLIPQAVSMTPDQADRLGAVLPGVFVTGLALILGHTVTDITAIWRDGIQSKPLLTATGDLVGAMPVGELKLSQLVLDQVVETLKRANMPPAVWQPIADWADTGGVPTAPPDTLSES